MESTTKLNMESTTKLKPSRAENVVANIILGFIFAVILALVYLIIKYPMQILLIPLLIVGVCLIAYISIRFIIMIIKGFIFMFF